MRGPDQLMRLRLAGLAASALTAAGAFGAGSLPGSNPSPGPKPSTWTQWLGIGAWLAGLLLLATVWWRLGAALREPRSAVSMRRLLVTGALWAAPLLIAPPLASRDVYAYACQGAVWLDGADPYRVGAAAGGCPWVEAVAPMWRDTTAPYGPLAIAIAGVVVALARAAAATEHGQLLVAVGLFRAVALAGGLLFAGSAPRLARACGVDPAAALWLGLLSPLVALHVVSGAHNDALIVGLVVAALALVATPDGWEPAKRTAPAMAVPWSEIAAGAALGLAAAIKVTAVGAMPFVVLLAASRTPAVGDRSAGPAVGRPGVRRYRALGRAGVAVTGGGVLAFAGLSVATGLGLGWFAALADAGQVVQWTSVPTGLGMAVGYALRIAGLPEAFHTAVAVARLLGLIALVAAGLALVVRAWRSAATGPSVAARRAVVTACGLAFAAVAALSPVFYPWYGLVAIAVLASALADDRWRRRLAATVLVLGFLVLPDGLGVESLTKLPGALFDVALVVALAVAVGRFAHRSATRRSATRKEP